LAFSLPANPVSPQLEKGKTCSSTGSANACRCCQNFAAWQFSEIRIILRPNTSWRRNPVAPLLLIRTHGKSHRRPSKAKNKALDRRKTSRSSKRIAGACGPEGGSSLACFG